MKNFKIIGAIISFVLVLSSCNSSQKPYKIAYVNIIQVYKNIPELSYADSVHQLQLTNIEQYIANANSKLSNNTYTEIELKLLTNAYNDTVTTYKQQVDKVYANIVMQYNNKMQKTIDSLAVKLGYNYVLSTINNNILYVKDSTDNITSKVIEISKSKE